MLMSAPIDLFTAMADKRKAPPAGDAALVKRARADEHALISHQNRKTHLSSPVISLAGAHGAEVLDVKYAPDGHTLAAASADKTISVWEAFGENRNIGQLLGHSSAVTCLAYVPGTEGLLVSGSADGTLIVWSTVTGEKLRRLRGHRGIVNSVSATRSASGHIASASDDGRVLIWDVDAKHPVDSIEFGYPITAIEWSDDATQLFVGGLDNAIHAVDVATKQRHYSLLGHTDTVASVALCRTGTHLVSAGLDDSVRVWDVRPYAPPKRPGERGSPRLFRTLTGMASGFEHILIKAAWSPDGERVASGGADRTSNLWDVEQGAMLLKLPGHAGTCTAVAFHPHEAVLASASTDGTVLLGELEE